MVYLLIVDDYRNGDVSDAKKMAIWQELKAHIESDVSKRHKLPVKFVKMPWHSDNIIARFEKLKQKVRTNPQGNTHFSEK